MPRMSDDSHAYKPKCGEGMRSAEHVKCSDKALDCGHGDCAYTLS